MTPPGAWPARRVIEALGTLAVVTGFAALVRFFWIDGYLPAPFIFDTNDTFMDWFHTAYWAHNAGAYTVWRSIYLPLSFVFTGLFADPRCYATSALDARQCDPVGIVLLIAAYVACVVVSAVAFHRNDRQTAMPRTIAVALGGPLLFALERGNLILFAYIGFAVLYGWALKSRLAFGLTAGFLVNMKVYLLFPILTLAIKRRWRALELSGLAALAIYLISLVIVGSGTPIDLASNLSDWFGSFAFQIVDQIVYSTTYQPYLLFDVLQYPIRDYVDQRTIDVVKAVIEYEVVVSRGLALLCLSLAWFYPKAVSTSRLAFFALMQSFIVQNAGGYSIAFIVFLLFLERKRNFATVLAISCAYLVSIPMDHGVATILQMDRVSWLSGRAVTVDYALTIGAIVRPGLLVIALWSIAIDTLIDIQRAVRAGPPVLGLVPLSSRSPAPLATTS